MNDNEIKTILKSIEKVTSPEGLKAKLYNKVISENNYPPIIKLSRLQRFFYTKPLRAASVLSFAISTSIWLAKSENCLSLLNNMMGR
jgi:hypothetical protein